MIVVSVGDEDCVDIVEVVEIEAWRPAQAKDAPTQEWIGQEPHAVELEHDGRMTQPAKPVRHRRSRISFTPLASAEPGRGGAVGHPRRPPRELPW
jgi:hypothetical protein